MRTQYLPAHHIVDDIATAPSGLTIVLHVVLDLATLEYNTHKKGAQTVNFITNLLVFVISVNWLLYRVSSP